MNLSTTTKHAAVRRRLEDAIRDGEFVAGEQLPGEHILAERYGVSYMTARKAVQDLVQSEMVERRARTGTFVRAHSVVRLQKKTLNLVTYDYNGAWQRKFVAHGIHLAEREGWNANVIRLTPGQQEPAIRAINNGELVIVFVEELVAESALAVAMRGAKGRAVLIDCTLSNEGIPSVNYDLRESIELAWNRLVRAGHTKIGCVVQTPTDINTVTQIGHWRECAARLAEATSIDHRLIEVETPKFHSPCVAAMRALTAYFAAPISDATALICLGDEMTLGVIKAAHDASRHVSVINIGDSPLLEVSVPSVTCVDADIEEQMNCAVRVLKLPRYKIALDDMRQLVKPHIIERQSVFELRSSSS